MKTSRHGTVRTLLPVLMLAVVAPASPRKAVPGEGFDVTRCDEVFRRGLRSYTVEQAGGVVTSAELTHAMETASGKDLSAAFTKWVHGPAPEDV